MPRSEDIGPSVADRRCGERRKRARDGFERDEFYQRVAEAALDSSDGMDRLQAYCRSQIEAAVRAEKRRRIALLSDLRSAIVKAETEEST